MSHDQWPLFLEDNTLVGDHGHLLNPSSTHPSSNSLPDSLHSTRVSAQSLTSLFPLEYPRKAPKRICLGVAKALLPSLNDKTIQESLLDTYKQKHRNKYMKFLGKKKKKKPMTDPWLYWPDSLSLSLWGHRSTGQVRMLDWPMTSFNNALISEVEREIPLLQTAVFSFHLCVHQHGTAIFKLENGIACGVFWKYFFTWVKLPL